MTVRKRDFPGIALRVRHGFDHLRLSSASNCCCHSSRRWCTTGPVLLPLGPLLCPAAVPRPSLTAPSAHCCCSLHLTPGIHRCCPCCRFSFFAGGLPVREPSQQECQWPAAAETATADHGQRRVRGRGTFRTWWAPRR